MSSPSAPSEETFARILEELRRRWRMAQFVPLLYLLGCLLIARFHFVPEREGAGFLPLRDETYMLLLFVGAAGVVLLARVLTVAQRVHWRRLARNARTPEEFLEQARTQQLVEFVFCDLAGGPGVILFLLTGKLFPLFAFLAASVGMFLKARPSALRLGEAMFRRELF